MNHLPLNHRPAADEGRILAAAPDSAELTLGYEAAYLFLSDAQPCGGDEAEAAPSYRPS
jgi:GAF domain-containing protein